ncbi:sarcosine oxidase subunit gamma [Paeniglutamicibacter antarcticus]|uniref:Sarcosine oxidase subunit gamma n=1 Tax=Arthrobacter terrae TaxID=2935737 RepID=A0A931G7W9_9MICC|nr:sarcosine oxidase subunit gamma family protein [Arthrobacter terrae]MBG0739724.1 sarcosine oxidase subunit gamma [Arthrobacter terrae]
MAQTAERENAVIRGLRRSPAVHLAEDFTRGSVSGVQGVTLREVPFLTMIGVRAAHGSAVWDRLGAVVGGLPERYGQVTGYTAAGGAGDSAGGAPGTAQGVSVLWLGPEEFLVIAPDAPDALDGGTFDGGAADGGAADGGAGGVSLLSGLLAALAGDPGQVVDLSSNRTTFELAGPSARAVLEKSCALDLHPREFTVGTAVNTQIGLIPAVLWRVDDDAFRIFPRASFADFLGRWLLDGMREFAAVEVH